MLYWYLSFYHLISFSCTKDSFFMFQMTMADLAVYEVLTNVVLRDSKILDKFPKLVEHRKRVAALPKIKEYLEKRPKTDV